jgi:hypothetical protein
MSSKKGPYQRSGIGKKFIPDPGGKKAPDPGFRIRNTAGYPLDPGSGKNSSLFRIPDRSRIQGVKKHRIRIRNTGIEVKQFCL